MTGLGAASPADNIDHRIGYLHDREIQQLQNRHAFHAFPSEMEGFGHSLMEAMSVGAVTLATDGAPMNELVQPQHGCLVMPTRSTTKDLSPRYFVDVAGIEEGVTRMLQLDETAVRTMSAAAQAHFQRADLEFRRRLPAAVMG
jgi:glycosyltransferase involved in cell wall biosynthesis